jgi:DNA polymerase-3 subunit beta
MGWFYDFSSKNQVTSSCGKALSLLLRNLETLENADQTKVNVSIGENHIVFRFEGTFIYSKLIEGEYPKYENVIPLDNDKKLIVNKDELIAAAKRVSIFSNSFTHQVKFMIQGNKMDISSEDVEFGGEGNEQIDVQFDGDSLEVAYNGVYILDLLRHLDTDEVIFKLKDSVSAAIVEPSVQLEGEQLTMLIMPIRINES